MEAARSELSRVRLDVSVLYRERQLKKEAEAKAGSARTSTGQTTPLQPTRSTRVRMREFSRGSRAA